MYSRVLGFSFSAGEMRPTIRLREGTVPPPSRILPMAAGTDPLPLQLRLQQTHLQILKDYAGQRSWKTVTSNWDTYDNLSGDISHISFPPRPPYLIPVGEHVCKRQSGFSLVYFGWCSFFFFRQVASELSLSELCSASYFSLVFSFSSVRRGLWFIRRETVCLTNHIQ